MLVRYWGICYKISGQTDCTESWLVGTRDNLLEKVKLGLGVDTPVVVVSQLVDLVGHLGVVLLHLLHGEPKHLVPHPKNKQIAGS